MARYEPHDPTQNGDRSRTRTSVPPVSGVLGTPDYMAPEQFQGRADVRSDVWGLGAILDELLTLRRPFRRQEGPRPTTRPRPRDLVHRLPRDLEAVCLKAVDKLPGEADVDRPVTWPTT